MSINNREDFLAYAADADGLVITDHLYFGKNRQVPPGTYTADWDAGQVDSVTFVGTRGRDTLLGGGGEVYTFFLGAKGDDLYGTELFTNAYVDYSDAGRGVFVDMTYRGSRTFTDESGATRTEAVIGRAHDGFGGTDYFLEQQESGLEGYSSIIGIFGSSHRDVMIADAGGFGEFYGGGGNDLLIGGFAHGGAGDDRLIGRATGDFSYGAYGEDGNDILHGTDFIDFNLVGGAGNDRIYAGAGDDGAGRGRLVAVTGNEGNDYVDGGAGEDFIDGGVGSDILVSGAGSDTINPDVEYFQTNPTQPRDGARDVIRVTRADLGAYRDRVLFNAFEEDRDQIRFGEAVRGGKDFRVYQEDNATNPGRVNTVLQIDWNGDGFGEDAPDAGDYFLVAQGADLSLHHGYLLT